MPGAGVGEGVGNCQKRWAFLGPWLKSKSTTRTPKPHAESSCLPFPQGQPCSPSSCSPTLAWHRKDTQPPMRRRCSAIQDHPEAITPPGPRPCSFSASLSSVHLTWPPQSAGRGDERAVPTTMAAEPALDGRATLRNGSARPELQTRLGYQPGRTPWGLREQAGKGRRAAPRRGMASLGSDPASSLWNPRQVSSPL